MRTDSAVMSEIGSWIVIVCALLTTSLIVRREYLQNSTAPVIKMEAIHVDGWEEALSAGIRTGSADAPVQVVEFADFECPYCASFETTIRSIRDKYPDQVAFTFVPVALPQHAFAEAAARIAECAHLQGRFEDMRSLLFEKQQAFGLVPWTRFAEQAGIPNTARFDACANETLPVERIQQGKRLAEKLSVRGTPTLIVNGWKLPVTPSPEDLDTIVKNVLVGKSPVDDLDFLVTSTRH